MSGDDTGNPPSPSLPATHKGLPSSPTRRGCPDDVPLPRLPPWVPPLPPWIPPPPRLLPAEDAPDGGRKAAQADTGRAPSHIPHGTAPPCSLGGREGWGVEGFRVPPSRRMEGGSVVPSGGTAQSMFRGGKCCAKCRDGSFHVPCSIPHWQHCPQERRGRKLQHTCMELHGALRTHTCCMELQGALLLPLLIHLLLLPLLHAPAAWPTTRRC